MFRRSRCCCRRSLSCRRSRFCFCGRRFATRLPCGARCAVSTLRAGILRPSARFARCASLARRLAALTAVCLAADAVRCSGDSAHPTSFTARRRCAPRSSPAAPSRIGSPRRHSLSRTPPRSPRAFWRPLSRRYGSPSARFPSRFPRRWIPRIRSIGQPSLARLSHRTHRWCPALHARAPDTAGVRLRRHETSRGRRIDVIVS